MVFPIVVPVKTIVVPVWPRTAPHKLHGITSRRVAPAVATRQVAPPGTNAISRRCNMDHAGQASLGRYVPAAVLILYKNEKFTEAGRA